jgi:hypothetical protein
VTDELKAKIERFTEELNAANVAFVVVVSVSGMSPRWWTNLQRYTQGAVDSIKAALNECGNTIAARRRGNDGARIIV